MNRITQDPDGSYRWDCPIETEYHRRSGQSSLLAVLIICAVVAVVFLVASHGTTDEGNNIWIVFLVIGVILVIAIPLILLWNSAGDPHEQYYMDENYVKSGYGKSSIYSEFKKTKEVIITEKYIEMSGKYRTNRIYIPSDDIDFVREFILKRLPSDTVIRK